MHARPGELFTMKGHFLGQLDRDARTLAARGSGSEPPCRVGWSAAGYAVLVNPCRDVHAEHGEMR